MPRVLELRNVDTFYGQIQALREVSIEVEEGQAHDRPRHRGPARGDGLEQEAVVRIAAPRADRRDPDEREEHEPALRLGEALEEGADAARVAVPVSGAPLPRPGVRPVEIGAVRGAVDLDPALAAAALRADRLAPGRAGALAPPLPAQRADHPIFTISRISRTTSSAFAKRSSGRGCSARRRSLSIASGTPGASCEGSGRRAPCGCEAGWLPVRRW